MKWSLVVVVLALAGSVQAADTKGNEPEERARRPLRVLHDPYEIASFYRLGGAPPAAPRYEDEDGRFTIDPRSISSFYRSDTSGENYRPRWRHVRVRPWRYER